MDNRPWRHLYKTNRWKALRLAQLREDPLCTMCRQQGFTEAASVVDHIKAHKGDVELFHDPANLQSLCKAHHDGAKQKEEARGTGAIGCDASGWPLDPSHHWYEGEGRGKS